MEEAVAEMVEDTVAGRLMIEELVGEAVEVEGTVAEMVEDTVAGRLMMEDMVGEAVMMEDTVGEMMEEHTVGVRRTQLQKWWRTELELGQWWKIWLEKCDDGGHSWS